MALIGKLLGDPFANTALLIEQDNRSDAWLFDCGFLRPLADKDLLRISTLFVSHAHIDHFIDFDFWLAAWVRQSRANPLPSEITCYGPPGFNRNVQGRLMSFLWNLTDFDLTLCCHEIDEKQITTIRYHSRHQFQPAAAEAERTALPPVSAKNPTVPLFSDPRLQVSCARLDHNTPSLGFRIIEPATAVINKAALSEHGLSAGAWLGEFKEALASKQPGDTTIATPCGPQALRSLRKKLIQMKPGHKLAFITDTIYNKVTAPLIEALAREVDTLFIESPFLHADLDQARETYHLTARQAGRVAAAAGAQKLVTFHYSPRYRDQSQSLQTEAAAAFTSQ